MGTRCKLSAGDFSTITGVSVPVLRLLARVRRSHSARVISVRPLSIPSATPLPAFSCAAPPAPASVLTCRQVRIAGMCREGNADIGTGVCATARGHNRSALRNIVAGGSSSTEAAEAGLSVWYCVSLTSTVRACTECNISSIITNGGRTLLPRGLLSMLVNSAAQATH